MKSDAAKDRKITLQFPNIEAIPSKAFSVNGVGVKTIVAVSAPKALTIRLEAFFGCVALTDVSFPVATTIENSSFTRCTALETVSFPLATSIEAGAFNGCAALTTVDIPKATNIYSTTFGDCPKLTTMKIATKSALTTLTANAFDGITDKANIKVTTGNAPNNKTLLQKAGILEANITVQ